MKKVVRHARARYDALPHLHRQVARFLVTGGINAVFAYVMYAVGARLLGMSYMAAQVFSWCLGVTFSFCMFRAFVFTAGDRSFRAFSRFLPTYVILLIVSLSMMKVMVGVLAWNDLIAQAIVIPVCAVLSFFFNRIIVFREKRP
jgi:putative flippase GtrA